jgi:WD40 repeat protein
VNFEHLWKNSTFFTREVGNPFAWPDYSQFATGSYEGSVKLWNIATQQEAATLETLPGSCGSLRFSPDGRTLAAGSWMGSEDYMSLFQAPSFEEIAAAEATVKTGSKPP